jgi:hypothetical protein
MIIEHNTIWEFPDSKSEYSYNEITIVTYSLQESREVIPNFSVSRYLRKELHTVTRVIVKQAYK